VARFIPSAYEQVQALAAVAPALARAGHPEQAAAVARSITDPDSRALAAVAEALAARGDTRQARHLASAACTVGRWTSVLGLVLLLEPSAVRAFIDLYLQIVECARLRGRTGAMRRRSLK
jgi:HEAT repeat protein